MGLISLPPPTSASRKEMTDCLRSYIDLARKGPMTYLEISACIDGVETTRIVIDGVYSCDMHK